MSSDVEKLLYYYVKDLQPFKNRNVAVLGGGDSALDWAQTLATVANVAIIHRRDQFRGLESTLDSLRKLKNVEFLTPYLPKQIELQDNQLLMALKEVGNTNEITRQFDKVIVAYGFRANNSFIKKRGIDLDKGFITVKDNVKTNIPGIYAIGDAISYPGRVPVIALGFGEAQLAVTAIMRNLFPEKKLTIHSTSI